MLLFGSLSPKRIHPDRLEIDEGQLTGGLTTSAVFLEGRGRETERKRERERERERELGGSGACLGTVIGWTFREAHRKTVILLRV